MLRIPQSVHNPKAGNNPGKWVITGGLGALGSLSAHWLTTEAICHISLLGRTGHVGLQVSVFLDVFSIRITIAAKRLVHSTKFNQN